MERGEQFLFDLYPFTINYASRRFSTTSEYPNLSPPIPDQADLSRAGDYAIAISTNRGISSIILNKISTNSTRTRPKAEHSHAEGDRTTTEGFNSSRLL